MKKYNSFNRNYLRKHLEKFNQLKKELENSKNKDEQEYEIIIENIENLEFYLENKNIKTLYEELEDTSLEEKRKNNKEYFKQEKNSLPIIREFNDIYQRAVTNLDLENFETEEFHDTSYTHKHIISMVNDFYMSIPDKDIKRIFNDLYKNRTNNVRFISTPASYCASTGIDDKQYITIDNSFNYPCFTSLVHEYAHAIHENYLERYISYGNDQYNELVSLFFQMLSSEYIKNIGNNKNRAIQDSIGLLIKMDTYANNIETYSFLRNKVFKTKDEAYDAYLNYLYPEEAEMALDYDAYLFHDYLIPYIIDLELLWEYKNDPEKSIYMLKHLIKNSENNYIEETKKLGLHLNSHEYRYIKHLISK